MKKLMYIYPHNSTIAPNSGDISGSVGTIYNAFDATVTEEINGEYYLKFKVPSNDEDTANLIVNNLISSPVQPKDNLVRLPYKRMYQLFRINSIEHNEEGFIEVMARHISYDMLYSICCPSTFRQNPPIRKVYNSMSDFCSNINNDLIGGISTFSFHAIDSIADRGIYIERPKDLRTIILEDDVKTSHPDLEWVFNNREVYAYVNGIVASVDNKPVFSQNKNVESYNIEYNDEVYYTCVIPYWRGSKTVENDGEYESQMVFVSPSTPIYIDQGRQDSSKPYLLDCYDLVSIPDGSEIPTEQQLIDAANRYIIKEHLGSIKMGVNINYYDNDEWFKENEEIVLGQSVTFQWYSNSEQEWKTVDLKVTKTVYNIDADRYENLYLGEQYSNLGQTLARALNSIKNSYQYTEIMVQDVAKPSISFDLNKEVNRSNNYADDAEASAKNYADTQDTSILSSSKTYTDGKISVVNGTINDAIAMITGSDGGYVRLEINQRSKEPEAIVIMDTDDEDTALNMWKWNQNGLYHGTRNGTSEPWVYNLAFTMAGTIDATLVRTGKITDGNHSFEIDLDNGTIKFGLNPVATTNQLPTKTSELTNDSNLAYASDIPTDVSELNNDANYATTSQLPTKTSQLTNDSNLAYTSDIPTKTSQLTNDSNLAYISDIPTDSIVQMQSIYYKKIASSTQPTAPGAWIIYDRDVVDGWTKTVPGYIYGYIIYTAVQYKQKDGTIACGPVMQYVSKSDIPTDVSKLNNDANYATTSQLPTKTSQLTNDSDFVTSSQLPVISGLVVDLQTVFYKVQASYSQPSTPTVWVTDTGTSTGVWTKTVPGYTENYIIYNCVQYKKQDESFICGPVSQYISSDIATEITRDTVTTSYVNALNITAANVAAENITGTTFSGKNYNVGGANNANGSIRVYNNSGTQVCTVSNKGIVLTPSSATDFLTGGGRFINYFNGLKTDIQPGSIHMGSVSYIDDSLTKLNSSHSFGPGYISEMGYSVTGSSSINKYGAAVSNGMANNASVTIRLRAAPIQAAGLNSYNDIRFVTIGVNDNSLTNRRWFFTTVPISNTSFHGAESANNLVALRAKNDWYTFQVMNNNDGSVTITNKSGSQLSVIITAAW